MDVFYKIHVNENANNRIEFSLINWEYIDGNEYLAKIFQEIYGFNVVENIDGIWFKIIKIKLSDVTYEMVWHEDIGNEIYALTQTKEGNDVLQQRLDKVLSVLNERIQNNQKMQNKC